MQHVLFNLSAEVFGPRTIKSTSVQTNVTVKFDLGHFCHMWQKGIKTILCAVEGLLFPSFDGYRAKMLAAILQVVH